jgi:exonuclease VII small subunit
VATSAMPMGIPGWPELAASTASIASARIAPAISKWVGTEAADEFTSTCALFIELSTILVFSVRSNVSSREFSVAQLLARPEEPGHEESFASGIDLAASRLEQAFHRLEQAVAKAAASQHSLKVDREKLNHLLQAADEKITSLREVATAVSVRLDHTIGVLEALDA